MKKWFCFLAVTSLLALVSCVGDKKNKIETDEVSVNSVDLSEVVKKYWLVVNDTTEGANERLEGRPLSEYDIPGLDSDYALEKQDFQHKELADYVSMYNATIICYDIISQHEKYQRWGNELDRTSIANLKKNISGFDLSRLEYEDVKKSIMLLQQCYDVFYEKVLAGKAADEDDIMRANEQVGETLKRYLQDPLADCDSEMQNKILDATLGWKDYASQPAWQSVLQASKEGRDEVFLKAVLNAKTFDDQCALCMLAGRKVSYSAVLPVMRALMDAGEYSPMLYYLWRGWRALAQISYYGISRDSVLADEWYNEYRKKVFLTCLHQLDTHPDDLTASANVIMFLDTTNTVRNGSFIMGNDAPLECSDIFEE